MISVLFFLFLSVTCFECPVRIRDVRLNSILLPVFVEADDTPRVSWKYEETGKGDIDQRNARQKYFQVTVFSSHEKLVYDTGKIESNQSSNVYLDGIKLAFSSTYSIDLQTWINLCGDEPLISDRMKFMTNIDPSLWDSSEWISGGNVFRSEFNIPTNKNISSSFLFISGVGYYKAYINGKSVSQRVLEPAWTNYNITILYSAFEVRSFLFPGSRNAIGAKVGNGWYATTYENQFYGTDARRSLRCILQIFFDDGSSLEIHTTSENEWKTTQSPIIMDSIYNGETYDARLEQPGWNEPYFPNSSSWSHVASKKNYSPPKGKMRLQRRPSILDKVIFYPISPPHSPKPGLYIFDMGQNFAGVCEIFVKGERGMKVILKHAELLNPDGTLYTKNLLTAKATDEYILKGSFSGEKYRPTFTYHGFRYVSVSGLKSSLIKDHNFSIRCIHHHSNVSRTGDIFFFQSSSQMKSKDTSHLHWWNTLVRSIQFGQTSNLMSIPTDCCQRDERLGWLGDTMLSIEESTFNFDMQSFYQNYMDVSFLDVFNNKQYFEVNDLPDVVPLFTQHQLLLYPGDPTWTSAFIMMTKIMYTQYADPVFLARMYIYLKKYVSFIDSKVRNIRLSDFWNTKYGDWCPPYHAGEHIKNYTASFYWIKTLQTMVSFAEILGHKDDEKLYSSMEDKYRQNFLSSFFFFSNDSSDRNHIIRLSDNSQTAIILGLELGIFDNHTSTKQKLVDILLENIIVKHRYHLNTGIIGTNYLFPVLTKMGYHDVAVAIASRTTFPGYGYMFLNDIEPATTLWELWNAPNGSYFMDSRNHIMLGSIASWLFKDVVGISNMDQGSVGFERIRIYPKITNLTTPHRFNATYDSKRGKIVIEVDVRNPNFCGIIDEGDIFVKNCETIGAVVETISFASFGRPLGRCGDFGIDPACHANDSLEVVKKLCVGKSLCQFTVSRDLFLPFKCDGNFSTSDLQLFVSGSCLMKSSEMVMKLEIPPNSEAIVCLPLSNVFNYKESSKIGENQILKIYESGMLIWEGEKEVVLTKGILSAWKDNECVNFVVGSGKSYDFLMTNGLCSPYR